MRKAQEVWAKARQNTSIEYFGDLAAENSIEPSSKSLKGEVPPIRKFGGQPQLEDVAFGLKPGELSGIIQLADKFVILKCEGRTKPVEVNPKEVHDVLYQDIFEKKLRMAMSEKFDDLRAKARIDNFLAGTSQARSRSPRRGGPSRTPPGRGTPSGRPDRQGSGRAPGDPSIAARAGAASSERGARGRARCRRGSCSSWLPVHALLHWCCLIGGCAGAARAARGGRSASAGGSGRRRVEAASRCRRRTLRPAGRDDGHARPR